MYSLYLNQILWSLALSSAGILYLTTVSDDGDLASKLESFAEILDKLMISMLSYIYLVLTFSIIFIKVAIYEY